jgi:hypothetical protein
MVNLCQAKGVKSTGSETGLAVTWTPGVEDALGKGVSTAGEISAVGVTEGTNIWQPATKKIKNSNNHFFTCIIPPDL